MIWPWFKVITLNQGHFLKVTLMSWKFTPWVNRVRWSWIWGQFHDLTLIQGHHPESGWLWLKHVLSNRTFCNTVVTQKYALWLNLGCWSWIWYQFLDSGSPWNLLFFEVVFHEKIFCFFLKLFSWEKLLLFFEVVFHEKNSCCFLKLFFMKTIFVVFEVVFMRKIAVFLWSCFSWKKNFDVFWSCFHCLTCSKCTLKMFWYKK